MRYNKAQLALQKFFRDVRVIRKLRLYRNLSSQILSAFSRTKVALPRLLIISTSFLMLSILFTTAYPDFALDATNSDTAPKAVQNQSFLPDSLTLPTSPPIQNTLASSLTSTVDWEVTVAEPTPPITAHITNYTAIPATNQSVAKLNSSGILSPGILGQPQPLLQNLVLVRLSPSYSQPELIEQLSTLEPIKAGRFQPIDYLPPDKDGMGERILAVVRKADESSFQASGLSYSRLDDNPDTAYYYAITLPNNKVAPKGESWLDPAWQVLDTVGNRVVFKEEPALFVGFGERANLQIDKLPPRIHLSGLTAGCPCAELAAATFASLPLLENSANLQLREQFGQITEENLKQVVNQIVLNEVPGKGALNTRYTGSAGSVYIAERLYNYFFALGLKVQYDSFFESAMGTVVANVIAEQPGEKQGGDIQPVLVVGHYDTIGERNLKGLSSIKIPAYGANDNGVGIAGLLEIARLLSTSRFKQQVRLIAFGGEEQGMLGSQHYAYYHLKTARAGAVFNIDSFGYNPGYNDWIMLGYNKYGANLKDALIANENKYDIGLGFVVKHGKAFFRSDDYYFDQLGYNAEVLTDTFSNQSPNNHTPNDKIEKVNFRVTRKTILLVLATATAEANQ